MKKVYLFLSQALCLFGWHRWGHWIYISNESGRCCGDCGKNQWAYTGVEHDGWRNGKPPVLDV